MSDEANTEDRSPLGLMLRRADKSHPCHFLLCAIITARSIGKFPLFPERALNASRHRIAILRRGSNMIVDSPREPRTERYIQMRTPSGERERKPTCPANPY